MEASPAHGDCRVCGNLTPRDGWYDPPAYFKDMTMHCLTTSADAGCKYCAIMLGAVNWAWDAYLRVCSKVSPVFVPRICFWIRPDRPFTVVVDYDSRHRGVSSLWVETGVALEFYTPGGKCNLCEMFPVYPTFLHGPRHLFRFFDSSVLTTLYVYLGFAQFHPRFSYMPEVPKFPASLDLEKLVSIVNPWLKQCDRDHLACQGKSFAVPKRLIDISGDIRLDR